MKLLKEILGQESEKGVFGGADTIAGIFLGDLLPVLVEHIVVGEHKPLLGQAVVLPSPFWGE